MQLVALLLYSIDGWLSNCHQRPYQRPSTPGK
jgi:hypothetical protein